MPEQMMWRNRFNLSQVKAALAKPVTGVWGEFSPRERQVATEFFDPDATLKEVALKCVCSRERISQIIVNIEKKLRCYYGVRQEIVYRRMAIRVEEEALK